MPSSRSFIPSNDFLVEVQIRSGFAQQQHFLPVGVEVKRKKENQNLQNMSEKPKLTYFNGRGRMESIRWVLAASGVEFEEVFLETREQYLKLIKDGYLLFDQVPLVEMDGLKLVQTKAILNYIAGKYNLLGKDLKERAQIDMYVEGTMDLMNLILLYPFTPPEQKEKQLAAFIEKTETRYLPVYEKALKHHNQEFLVGNQLSLADIQLLEAILMLEEKKADILAPFPQLQAFKARISSFPTIKKFLEPGSQRKPIPDDAYVAVVLKVLQLKLS
ncbi:glutathione S-transferase 3-like isoform X1 [Notechis scutatus]|uniref:glutathione transferase n=2 Tax=Notechis scutatus TaxID=8663 RepID=A0A6J1TRP8_9SAUR|nr:glutathione S-transferase 3-like isoform X1 [Notechis scutatus]